MVSASVPTWRPRFSHDEWAEYRRALDALRMAGVTFALGGGLAYSYHSGFWRNTKDIDLYVLPKDRGRAIAAVTAAGFADYFEQHEYDRSWIYRSVRNGLIVDVIWQMANHRAAVTLVWLARSLRLQVNEICVPLLAVEELVFAKLYVLQRERCDWPDVLNLLFAQARAIDWEHLLTIVDEDVALLRGVVSVLTWMRPETAMILPIWLWRRLGMVPPSDLARQDGRRVRLLDTRPWFIGVERERDREADEQRQFEIDLPHSAGNAQQTEHDRARAN